MDGLSTRARHYGVAFAHEGISAALAEWVALLGEPNVLADARSLESYGLCTLPSATRPLAVLRPACTEEVVGLVKIAGRFELPLYPLSRGRNTGYGDACAVSDRQVVVDLSRMNRIVELDENLAYAVIEPGVTQGQLSTHLRDNRIPLWLDCTGAGPEASIVGNLLERGFGHTPYGNRVQTMCGLEVVLADGSLLKTGFGHYRSAKARYAFPYGLGPWLDGLFTQSNFGIVTRVGLWLMPEPEEFLFFSCIVGEESQLAGTIEAVRTLRMNGTLRSIAHVANDLRLISSKMSFPRNSDGGLEVAPLSSARRGDIAARSGYGAWQVSGGLYGTRAQVRAARRDVARALRGPGRQLIFVDDWKLRLGRAVAPWLSWSRWGRSKAEQIAVAESVLSLNRGAPISRFLRGAYWRNRHVPTSEDLEVGDPKTDNCGMIWLSPLIPMTGDAARALLDLVAPIFSRHGFDLPVTFSTVNERSLGAVLTICYDKECEDEVARAAACYDEAFKSVMDAGFIPYRVGIQSMADLGRGSDTFWGVIGRLKNALDEQGILSPGRYQP